MDGYGFLPMFAWKGASMGGDARVLKSLCRKVKAPG